MNLNPYAPVGRKTSTTVVAKGDGGVMMVRRWPDGGVSVLTVGRWVLGGDGFQFFEIGGANYYEI